ncbi:uncharacterized protein LOC134282076 [Saccostrea cucullata]|uniref:uncharacterized protein LOC134282076 n=1 Tax=Saccostrea cuccullata TaxID=36930 RepID=UPI002ED4AE7B
MHEKRMREIEDKRAHKQLLNQVHEELLKIFNAKRKEQEKRDPQKILKYRHKILMKNIETKQHTNSLIPGAHRHILERIEAKKIHTGLLKNVHIELMNLVKMEEKTTEKRTVSSTLKVLADTGRQLIDRILKCFQWF